MPEYETLSIRLTHFIDQIKKPFQSTNLARLAAKDHEKLEVVSINTMATLNQMPCVEKISNGVACNASDWIVTFDPGKKCIDQNCRFAKVIKRGTRAGLTRCSRRNERRQIS